MVWDMAVNAGVKGSVKILQTILGVDVDGELGPETLEAISNNNTITLINNLASLQTDYYKSLNVFIYFGKGWLNRVNARQATALGMLTKTQTVHIKDDPPPQFWNNLGKNV
jgi:lysozyme family protein